MQKLTGPWPHLDVELKGHALWARLNRPEAKNAISMEMVESLEEVLSLADGDPRVRVVVLAAHGAVFCAGGDVKDMLEQKGMFAGDQAALRENYRRGIQRIPKAIEDFGKPLVAMVDGAAIGAGCDLACMADLRVISPRAEFRETFARLALVPGDGGTFFLSRLIGYGRAMEMFLTGEAVKGERALQWGLANAMVAPEALEAETQKLVDRILQMAPIALRFTKEALKRARTSELREQLDLLATFQGISQRTQDHFEGVRAIKEKRDPLFKGE